MMQPRAAGGQHLEPFRHVGYGSQPLNCTNLASHTISSVCGKRSRSNSNASSSCSSAASYDSVFSPVNARSESGYESQTSLELSPRSRKSSSGESQQHLASLSDWRSSLNVIHASQHCYKKAKCDGGKIVQLSHPRSDEPAPSLSGSSTSSVANVVHSPSSSPAAADGKIAFVDNLVDTTVRTLDVIWNASATGVSTSCDLGERQTGLPLHIFVRETLRRGRTSCSTLQTALLYCVRLSEVMQKGKLSATPCADTIALQEARMVNCPRRMFLAAVMVSSKFLQDRTYSNRAWSKISGLPVRELGKMERAFLAAIDYRLMVSDGEWEDWVAKLMKAPTPSALPDATRRSSLSRSTSDNVTGAAIPLDTELHAASPEVMSMCHPKYRNFAAAPIEDRTKPSTGLISSTSSELNLGSLNADLSLPYPMMGRVVSAQM